MASLLPQHLIGLFRVLDMPFHQQADGNTAADVIISDMRMPMMSGTEYLKAVRERWPDSFRIVLTGFADMDSMVSAVNEGGINAYLSKPWDDMQLIQTIRGGLERKHLVDERNALLALTARQNDELTFLNEGLEDAVRARTAELKQSSAFLELTNKKLKRTFIQPCACFPTWLNCVWGIWADTASGSPI